jgi:uncharacterized protein Yka (UPF0111/DUF47 family)
MISKLFGQDAKFYDLLEASAAEAWNSAVLLSQLPPQIGTEDAAATLAEISQSRRNHKGLYQETTKLICLNFVTPLEREDIEALSAALFKIPKTVEKVAERLSICPPKVMLDMVVKQMSMLQRSTETLIGMVGALRKKHHVEKIQDAYHTLQEIEGDADKLMVGLLRDLYQGSVDAKEVIILKDIYELLERAIDRCRDAGNVVFEIVLKYS